MKRVLKFIGIFLLIIAGFIGVMALITVIDKAMLIIIILIGAAASIAYQITYSK